MKHFKSEVVTAWLPMACGNRTISRSPLFIASTETDLKTDEGRPGVAILNKNVRVADFKLSSKVNSNKFLWPCLCPVTEGIFKLALDWDPESAAKVPTNATTPLTSTITTEKTISWNRVACQWDKGLSQVSDANMQWTTPVLKMREGLSNEQESSECWYALRLGIN